MVEMTSDAFSMTSNWWLAFPSKSTAALRSLRKRCNYRWPCGSTTPSTTDLKSMTTRKPFGDGPPSWLGVRRRRYQTKAWRRTATERLMFPPIQRDIHRQKSRNSMHEGCQARNRCRSRTGRAKKAKNDRTAF